MYFTPYICVDDLTPLGNITTWSGIALLYTCTCIYMYLQHPTTRHITISTGARLSNGQTLYSLPCCHANVIATCSEQATVQCLQASLNPALGLPHVLSTCRSGHPAPTTVMVTRHKLLSVLDWAYPGGFQKAGKIHITYLGVMI